jgi:hypothetical protein
VEMKISKTNVIAEKAIEFREFDINEGFVRGKILFIDGSALEFLEYLKDDIRLKYRFHYEPISKLFILLLGITL